jgi:hypothetical protein
LTRVVRLVKENRGGASLVDPLMQAIKDGRDLRDYPALAEDRRGRQIPARLTLFPLRDRDKVVGAVVTLQVSTPVET